MKTIFKTAIYVSVLLAASSCVLDDIDTQITDEQALAMAHLECDALESYTVTAEQPRTVHFRITSNTPWSITVPEEADWLTVSPLSSDVSSLSSDISVKADANTEFVDREVVITVKARDIDTKYNVTVKQTRTGQLEVAPVEGEFEKTGQTLPFTITANNAWTVSAADEWLTFDKTSGDSEGIPTSVTVQATAAANPAIVRKTTVTVTSGDLTETFEAVQNGETLEFVTTEEAPAVDRKGGELLLDVNATLDWKVECESEWFTAEKVGNQVKVTAPWNNAFAPRKATLLLKPTAEGLEGVSSSAEVTQAINFSFEGNCEVLEDGSVKISSGAKSRVNLLDQYSYLDMTLTFGEKNFKGSGQLWVQGKVGEVNIYNQLSIDGNQRIRTDGNIYIDGAQTSCYASGTFSPKLTADNLNAMETYHYKTAPQAADETHWDMLFEINGSQIKSQSGYNPFYYNPGELSDYWFGFSSATTDGTWYIIKTCDIK